MLSNYKQTKCHEFKPRSGCPKKLSEREEPNITTLLKCNPRLTVSQISKDIEFKYQKKLCSDTVRKVLKDGLCKRALKQGSSLEKRYIFI